MKKTLCLVLCLMLIVSSVFATGQAETTKQESFTLKLGHASTTESTRHKALLVFKDYVEKE